MQTDNIPGVLLTNSCMYYRYLMIGQTSYMSPFVRLGSK